MPDVQRTPRRLRLPSAGVSSVIVVAVLIGAAVLSLWWPYECEQRAIRQLEAQQLHVMVQYDFVGPELLRSSPVWEWTSRVRELRVHGPDSLHRRPPATAPVVSLPSLASLGQCTSIELFGLGFDEQDSLRGVAQCGNVRTISFIRCGFSSDVLRGLDGLDALQDIRLTFCSVQGELLELPAAPNLRSFRSIDTTFRMLDVSGTPELRRIEAKNGSFSDAGASLLTEAPHLAVLMVPNGTLTDAAVDDLLQLRKLQYLDLRYNSQMTRSGLERLADLPRLRTVNVWRTGADRELAELRQVLPQAKSTYEP